MIPLLRTAWIWTASAILILLWTPLLGVVRLFDREPRRLRTGRWFRKLGRVLAGVNPWRIHISGGENLHANQVYVVVSNHQSLADIPLISHLKLDTKWLAKAELFRVPLVGWMLRMAGDVPVERSDRRKSAKALLQCARYLRQHCSVVFFPEGTRSPDRRVLPFNEGPFQLAIRAHIPILPLWWTVLERLCLATRGSSERPRISISEFWRPSPSMGGASSKCRRCEMRFARESWTNWIGCAQQIENPDASRLWNHGGAVCNGRPRPETGFIAYAALAARRARDTAHSSAGRRASRSRSPRRPRTVSRNRACGIRRLRHGRRESRGPRCTQTARGRAPSGNRAAPAVRRLRCSSSGSRSAGCRAPRPDRRIARCSPDNSLRWDRRPARSWTPIPAAFRSAIPLPGPCTRNSAPSHSPTG